MTKFRDEFKIVEYPTKAIYKKKENGLYEIIIEDYIFESPEGERYTGKQRLLSYLNVNKDEGVIFIENLNDLSQFKPIVADDEHKTIFEIIIPEVKNGE